MVTLLCLFVALLSFTFESTLEAISSRCILVYLFTEMAIDFIKHKPRSKQNFWASWNSDTRNLYVDDVVNNMDNLSMTVVWFFLF